MSYDNTLATGDVDFVDQSVAETAGMVFYNTDRVECSTCHDVHEYTNIPFLRISNSGSALCVTCHLK